MKPDYVSRLCRIFLVLNFLVFLPLESLVGTIAAWGITGVPAALHCYLRRFSHSAQTEAGRKTLARCSSFLFVILVVNVFTVIMQMIQPDAFILIAIAMLGGSIGLLHIIITALLMAKAKEYRLHS